jgi:HPt (histidine-containing phosphotransfer) domain-containing protein
MDRPAIQRFAHKIKGGARSSCADLLGDHAALLEDQAMELPDAALHEMVARLGHEIDRIPADLTAWVSPKVA